MKKYIYLAVAILGIATATSSEAKLLYGVVNTNTIDGNAHVVSVDIDALSADRESPTPVKFISALEAPADFMAGTTVKGAYYCFYNIFDMDNDSGYQYFGTLDMGTGKFNQIAEENQAYSNNVTDMMDITYDEYTGMLIGMDRQYSYGRQKLVSTLQNISLKTGNMSEVLCFDNKYVGIHAVGDGTYYLATMEKNADNVFEAEFYKADERFNITHLPVKGERFGESNFAHSMTMDGNNLYLLTGTMLVIVDLNTNQANTYYLEKKIYGITFTYSDSSSVNVIEAEICDSPEYYTIDGVRIANPSKGQLVICRRGDKVTKMIL